MKIPVSHFISLPPNSDPVLYEIAVAEFASNGAKHMVAGTDIISLSMQEDGRDFIARIQAVMNSTGMTFRGAHSFWGAEWDLNQLDPALHEKVIANQKKVIDLAAEFNAGVLVIHPGDHQFAVGGDPAVSALREQTIRTLEVLLPYAEKREIRISLENIIAPSDSAAENLAVLEYFKSPSLVCCYDTGHANVMEAASGKDPAKVCDYIRHTLWHDHLILDPEKTLERLAPYIVTAHVHDNSGYSDEHLLPGTGTIDWQDLTQRLEGCPNLEFVQNEVNRNRQRIPVREAVLCFDRLFNA